MVVAMRPWHLCFFTDIIVFDPATYIVSESDGSVDVTVVLRAGTLEGITAAVTLSAISLTAQGTCNYE